MTRTKIAVTLSVIAVIAAGGLVASRMAGSTLGAMADPSMHVPTARVAEGSIALDVHLVGELRASRQSTLPAPAVGTTLRLLRLLETGTRVAEGDIVAEFDPSDQQFALEQAESELREVEQEILKRQADIAVQVAQDKVTLLTAQFDVRRAELDTRADTDLISANEYKIRQVTLEEAKRRLEQVEQDITARTVTSQASLQVLDERLTRARLSANRAREAMKNLSVASPMAGLVSVRENMDGLTMMYTGMTLPTYRVGDDVRAGRPLVDVLDVSTMEITGNVSEEQRVNVRAGQKATVTTSSAPGAEYTAEVTAVSGVGRPDYRAGPLRQFEVTFELASPDDRLRPGASVQIRVEGNRLDGVLMIPRQAVFDEDGQSVVYVPLPGDGTRFESRAVKVLHRSETMVAVEGIDAGTEVALVHPASVRATVTEREPPAAPAGVSK